MASTKVSERKIRILLVDDHAVVRFGMARLMEQEPDLMVCGEEEDASRALAAISRLKPDLVIADISLKDSSGLVLMRNIKVQYPKLPVLVVSTLDETLHAEAAFRAGALGYVMKSGALEQIIPAIRRVLAGNLYVSDALAARLLEGQVRGHAGRQRSAVEGLSDRELEVFRLIGEWKKTGEIARELHLSVKTIEYYREQLKLKLNLKSGAELTRYATGWMKESQV